MRSACFYLFINAIKKVCEKHMLLKQHVFLTCKRTHVNLICELYKISYKSICRKYLSFQMRASSIKSCLAPTRLPIKCIDLFFIFFLVLVFNAMELEQFLQEDDFKWYSFREHDGVLWTMKNIDLLIHEFKLFFN